MNILVVGRHIGEIPGDVVKQVSPQYPAGSDQTKIVAAEIFQQAAELGAVVIFQACPAQLAVALHEMIQDNVVPVSVGFIVSVPGERPAGAEYGVKLTDESDIDLAAALVKWANPSARVKTDGLNVSVVVDRPMQFKFSHIEWLYETGE